MKSVLRHVDDHGKKYDHLMFVCPGCVAGAPKGYAGIHALPVNVTEDIGKPSWSWDGNLEAPTLSPSILSEAFWGKCHSFLRKGVFEFLSDCDHPLANQKVPIPDLPDWVEEM